MTKLELYEQIVRFSSELASLNLACDVLKASKTGKTIEVQKVFEKFKEENFELYQEIEKFSKEYKQTIQNAPHDLEIFGIREDTENGIFVYDPNIINTPNFYMLILLGEIDESYLFLTCADDDDEFVNELEVYGGQKLAEFVSKCAAVDFIHEKYLTIYDFLLIMLE